MPDLNAYFDQALDVFHNAARCAGDGLARDYRLAGATVRVQFASQGLVDGLQPALVHLAETRSAPSLSVYAWGGEMPGGMLAPPPWDRISFYERGNVRGWQSEQHSLLYDRRAEVFNAVDHRRGLGLFWVRDGRDLNFRERATPLRRLLQLWLEQRGLLVLHAAAVGQPGGGLLLAGRNGSGKSTTALACLGAALRYAGDDYVAVALEPQPHVYGLYNSAKLSAQAVAWLPQFEPLISNRAELSHEKALVYLAPTQADCVSAGFPLRAIVLPCVGSAGASLTRRIEPQTAYKALLPDALLGMLGDARLVPAVLGPLLQQVPCYRLELGSNLADVASTVAGLLSEHAG